MGNPDDFPEEAIDRQVLEQVEPVPKMHVAVNQNSDGDIGIKITFKTFTSYCTSILNVVKPDAIRDIISLEKWLEALEEVR